MKTNQLGEIISPENNEKLYHITDVIILEECKQKILFLDNSLSEVKDAIYGKKNDGLKNAIKETTVSYFLDKNIIKRPISLFYNEIKVEWKYIAFKSNIDTDNTTILLHQLFDSIVVPDTIIAESFAIQFGIKYSSQRFYIVKKNDFIFLTWGIKTTPNTKKNEAIYKKKEK